MLVPVKVTVKVYHCVNADGHFDGQNVSGIHSFRQSVRYR